MVLPPRRPDDRRPAGGPTAPARAKTPPAPAPAPPPVGRGPSGPSSGAGGGYRPPPPPPRRDNQTNKTNPTAVNPRAAGFAPAAPPRAGAASGEKPARAVSSGRHAKPERVPSSGKHQKPQKGERDRARGASPPPGKAGGGRAAERSSSRQPAPAGAAERGKPGTPGVTGLPLLLKFALSVSVLVVSLVTFFGLFVYYVATQNLRREIQEKGEQAARMLASLGEIFDSEIRHWENFDYRNNEDAIKGYYDQKMADINARIPPEEQHAAKKKTRKEWIDGLDKAIQARVINTRNEKLKELRNTDRARLQRAFPEKGAASPILNAFLFSAEAWQRQIILYDDAVTAAIDTNHPGVQTIATPGKEDVYVRRYLVPVGAGKDAEKVPGVQFWTRVKSYDSKGAPLQLSDKERMWAVLILSARKVEQAENTLRVFTLLGLFLSAVFGVGIGFLLARQITRPVTKLMQDMTEVAHGDLRHETSLPTTNDEIGALTRQFIIMQRHVAKSQDQEIELQKQKHELHIAKEIQENLTPKEIPAVPGYDIAAFYQPSKEVGGDYYDILKLDEEGRLWGFIVADVSGKGVPGSMVMTMTRALLRYETLNRHNASPKATFIQTNKTIAQDIRRGMFVTAMFIVLDTRDNRATIASAGHNPAVVWRRRTGEIELVNPGGIALGFDKGPIFERTIQEKGIPIEPGDRLVMYTDGVTEAMSPRKEEFKEENLFRVVKESATLDSRRLVAALQAALERHRGDAEQSDDISILTFRRS